MADYYSVLKKTVAALPENTGAARRAIYQRARTAIVNQLKAYDPPLAPSEITNEQLRLEEAIRKVEAEAARETLGLNRPPAPPPASPAPPVAAEGPAAAPAAPEVAPPPAKPAQAEPEIQAPSQPPVQAPAPEPAASTPPAPAAEERGPVRREEMRREERAAGSPPRPRPPQAQDVIRREPAMDRPGAPGNGARSESGRTRTAPAYSESVSDRQQFDRVAAEHHDGLKPSRLPMYLGTGVILLVLVGIGAVLYSQRDAVLALLQGGDETPAVVEETQAPAEPDAEAAVSGKNADRLPNGSESPAAPDARTVTTTRISPAAPLGETVAPAPEADAGEVAPETPVAQEEGTDEGEGDPLAAGDGEGADPALEEPSTPQEQAVLETEPAAQEPATGPAATPSVPQGATTVAQRSILYEEGEESNGSGTASPGQVVWSVDKTDDGGKEVTVLKIKADITDRNVAAEVSIKPNSDSSLPASHLVEVKFDLPSDFPNKGVADVPGLVMKMTEEARGDALVGASVKVADGYFWVALSNVPNERERNLALLKERGWIDIPILYEDGKRAILTLEKGTPGVRAVDQALAAWQ